MKNSSDSLFDRAVSDNEKLLWSYRPVLTDYLMAYRELWYATGMALIFFFSFLIVELVTPERAASWKFFALFPAVGILAFTYMLGQRILSLRQTGYAFSERHVFFSRGMITPEFKVVDVRQIRSIEIKQGWLQRLSGKGDIRFFTGEQKIDESGLTIKSFDQWEAVDNPHEVFKALQRLSGGN